MRKQTFINEVREIKSGEKKNGEKWTLFKVIDEDGEVYMTFETKYLQMVNQPTELNYTETKKQGKNGQWFTDRTLIEPWQQPAPKWTPPTERIEPTHDDEPRRSYPDVIKPTYNLLDEQQAERVREKLNGLPNDTKQMLELLSKILSIVERIEANQNPEL